MPEEAYEWMWRTLKSGCTWQALVKNRSKKGDYYWVEANVSPIYNEGEVVGYRSIRFKPDRSEVDKATAFYADIKAGRIKAPFKQGKLSSLLSNIKLWQKFVVLIVLAILMFAVPTYFLINRSLEEKHFALNEKHGVDYVSETTKLMQLVLEHRGLGAAVIAGNTTDAGNWDAKRNEITRQLSAIDELDIRLSSLGLSVAWSTLRNEWLELASHVNQLDAKANIDRHNQFITHLQAFNRKISDASGIALDPEAGTYYLGVMAISLFPDLSEQLGRLRATGVPILQKKVLTTAEAAYLDQLIGSTLEKPDAHRGKHRQGVQLG
jgi:methyl-accepting chemotaxis protein